MDAHLQELLEKFQPTMHYLHFSHLLHDCSCHWQLNDLLQMLPQQHFRPDTYRTYISHSQMANEQRAYNPLLVTVWQMFHTYFYWCQIVDVQFWHPLQNFSVGVGYFYHRTAEKHLLHYVQLLKYNAASVVLECFPLFHMKSISSFPVRLFDTL